jgi:hypothetical protein
MMAMAIGVCLAVPGTVSAQSRGNVQAEQNRNLPDMPVRENLASGRYESDGGDAFILDQSGARPLLRFEGRPETWVLRPTAAPRGDVIYRNDAGEQVLRVSSGGGMTIYSSRNPGGSPASWSGNAPELTPPTLGPMQLGLLIVRSSAAVSQSLGRLVEVNVETSTEAEAATVDALIISTDTVIRMARSATARQHLANLRRISIEEGSRNSVRYANGELRVVVTPSGGGVGRPSSARVIRAFMPSE